jgi:hypothetical protein
MKSLFFNLISPHLGTAATHDKALFTLKEVRRTLLKKYHPDKGAKKEEIERLQCIAPAYKFFSDPETLEDMLNFAESTRRLMGPKEPSVAVTSSGMQEHSDVSVPVPTIADAALCEFDGIVSALKNKTIYGECLHNAKPIRKLVKNKYKKFPVSASDSLMQILDRVAKRNDISKANERLHAAAIFFIQVLQSDTGGDPDAVPPTEGSVVAEGSARSVPNGSGDDNSNADIDAHIDTKENVETSISGARQMPFQDDELIINVPYPMVPYAPYVPHTISELTVDSRMLESATPNNASGSRKRKKTGGDVMTRNSNKKRKKTGGDVMTRNSKKKVEDVLTRNSKKLIKAVKKKEIILNSKTKEALSEASITRYRNKVDKLLKGDIKGIPIYDMTNPFDVLQNAFDNHKDAIAENDSRSNGQLRNAIERFLELPKNLLQFETA